MCQSESAPTRPQTCVTLVGKGHAKDPYDYHCPVCGGLARYSKRSGEIECLVCGAVLDDEEFIEDPLFEV